jgi:hypothetical protein
MMEEMMMAMEMGYSVSMEELLREAGVDLEEMEEA